MPRNAVTDLIDVELEQLALAALRAELAEFVDGCYDVYDPRAEAIHGSDTVWPVYPVRSRYIIMIPANPHPEGH